MRANPATLRRERRVKLTAFLFVLVLTGLFILANTNIFISLLFAVLLVYMLKPIITMLERLKFSRSASISFVFSCITVLFVLLGYVLAPHVSRQFVGFEAELPRYKQGMTQLAKSVEFKLNELSRGYYSIDIMDAAEPYAQKYLEASIQALPARATDLLTILLLAPFFAFFLLKDGRSISRALFSLVPNNLFETVLSISYKINVQIGGFIRARFIEALIVGGVVLIGLQLIDFPYAVLLSVIAGATNLIPYLGPVIGAVPALVVASIDMDGSGTMFAVVMIYLLANMIDMAIIVPFVVAKIVNLHPVLVVLAIIIGAQVGGIVGMIICIPVASTLILIFSSIYGHLLAQKTDI